MNNIENHASDTNFSYVSGSEDVNVETFVDVNQKVLAELLTFIDFADDKLTIGFVEINLTPYKKLLIDILVSHPQNQ